jgi:hypothetical protein
LACLLDRRATEIGYLSALAGHGCASVGDARTGLSACAVHPYRHLGAESQHEDRVFRAVAHEGPGFCRAHDVVAIDLPILYFAGGGAVSISKSIAASILGFFKEIPVAERISIELVLWGTPATIALLLLVLGWLYLFGKIVKRQAALAVAGDPAFTSAVRQWDLMRVPADQPLVLTAITAVGVCFVLLLWAFMPVTTPHPHESEKKDVVKAPIFKPTDALQKTEKVIAKAEAAVQSLEEKAATESHKEEKGKGKPAVKDTPKSGAESAKPMKAAVTPEKEHSHGAEDHKH